MDIFTAIAEPTRRNIIEMLAGGSTLSASEICEKFAASPPSISQHLKVLREAELVQVEKKAQKRFYQLNPEKMQELETWILKMTKHWNKRFDVLEELLKKEKARL